MDLTQAKSEIKKVLTDKRYEHSLRVCDMALSLRHQFSNLEEEQIALAAIFHDYAKCFSKAQLKQYIIDFNIDKDLLNYHHELWHGPVASRMIAEKFKINDSEIQSAIYYHTTGKAKMGPLDYLIYVADYIEPKRDFPAVYDVRKLAKDDVTQAFQLAIKHSIQFLIDKNAVIHPDSLKAYNYTRIMKERSVSDRN